jgi:phage terminase large subunit-like protein
VGAGAAARSQNLASGDVNLTPGLLRIAGAKLLELHRHRERRAHSYDWLRNARPEQIPAGEPGSYSPRRNWELWLVMAGRGFGKTRSGAEACRAQVDAGRRRRIALVAPTLNDARKLMIEGDSGLEAVYPRNHPNFPRWVENKREIYWPNGAIGYVYTSEEPNRFRGPQHDFAWCEEVGAWRNAETCWDNLAFGMRITGPLGDHPQIIATTTPRPTRLMRRLVDDPNTEISKGRTYDNEHNLDPVFLRRLMRYEGTRLGQQELDGILLGDTPGAMFTNAKIEAGRVLRAPDLIRVVVAIDPAVADLAERQRAELEQTFLGETGIVVAGVGRCRCQGAEAVHGFVLADLTDYYQPEAWAKVALDAFDSRNADRIVAEVNNGGALVEANLRACARGRRFAYRAVHASRGKAIRAEPIATMYEKLEIHHVGVHPKLEDELTTWNPLLSPRSPNRLDADVWALTDLMLGPNAVRSPTTLMPNISAPRRI